MSPFLGRIINLGSVLVSTRWYPIEPWSGCTRCLYQPFRSPPTPFGYLGGWYTEAQQLFNRPTMIREPRRLGGSALHPLPTERGASLSLPPHTLVRPAEVVA